MDCTTSLLDCEKGDGAWVTSMTTAMRLRVKTDTEVFARSVRGWMMWEEVGVDRSKTQLEMMRGEQCWAAGTNYPVVSRRLGVQYSPKHSSLATLTPRVLPVVPGVFNPSGKGAFRHPEVHREHSNLEKS